MSILDSYVMKTPSEQNAIDLFAGEWISKVPGDVISGDLDLYTDDRIHLIGDFIGGYQGKDILELGPLEAMHTACMSKLGAKRILGIEANSRAFLKCLIVKDLLGLENANFLLGDFTEYKAEGRRFDLACAIGVIYHCPNPVRTLVQLCGLSDQICIWSQYYREKEMVQKFSKKICDRKPTSVSYQNITCDAYRFYYGDSLKSKLFLGGGKKFTNWMPMESWRIVFEEMGFDLEVLHDDPNHQNGPAFTGVATKR